MIRAVVFDVGKVLFDWDMRILIRQFVADEAEVEYVFANVVSTEWHFQQDAGVPLGEMVPTRIAEFPQYAAVIRAYASRFNETIPGPIPGSFALVEELHARSVPLYALTNFGAELWPIFSATQPVFTRFRDIVVSGVEKLTKPDPAIYRLAERRFGHSGAELLFIDDNRDNVEAARACGWEAHHFADAPTLALDLRQRGLIG
ncbi:MAG: HAD family phosphatase [Novosphingobium sp.]